MSDPFIRLVPTCDLPQALDLLGELNADVARGDLERRLEAILEEHPHYEMYGAYDDGRLIGVVGAWVATKVWCGRYLEIDNMVVGGSHRSRGVGSRLLAFMEELACERGCELMVLDSYTANHASHRLYHRMGYVIKGFHFTKGLVEGSPQQISA